MGLLRHIISLAIAVLITGLSAVAMPMAPTASHDAEFFPYQPAAVTEHADVHFAARAPPMAVANVAFTGAAVAEHGNGIIMHGNETHVVSLGFGVGLDATNSADDVIQVPNGPDYTPTTIGGRQYSSHALKRMNERGLTPSVVENTVDDAFLVGQGNRPNTIVYYDPTNRV